MNFSTIGKKEGLFELIEIPETFGPLKYTVDDHKIKTYAFTQNDYHPWYFNDSPFGKRIGHASILGNDLLSLFLTKYDPNSIIGLHTQEEMWFHNPVYVDEEITIQGEYTEKYKKRNKGYVVMKAEARGADGRLIVQHRGVEIMRIHAGAVVAKKTAKVNDENQVTGEYDIALEPAPKASSVIKPGTPIPFLEKRTSQEQASVFSWVGKYFKNIHNNLEQAQKAGLALPLVQGQQQFGYLTEMLTGFFGEKWFTSGWQKVKFIHPITVGEKITCKGVVKECFVENDETKLRLEIWVENEDGVMTSVGWASASV
ncbi:MaoC family dehydratase [Alkalihalobacillus oceani]|uniref:MaoC family dehydratase n=1 Tax=Halalkalibacter oceani TaxID=1653776 RepID=UPI00204042ED|nr:MaoC family dehydratase [Halalkalibacter oceani]MCM3763252.1 MaoC family dehydratase [Halalkalibacter oceani]